jgi:eukaryotic-like serine/threonine-protein kinase
MRGRANRSRGRAGANPLYQKSHVVACGKGLRCVHLVPAPWPRVIVMPPKEVHLPVALGAVLAGRYRVEQIIGVGGMAWSWPPLTFQLDQPVAIKFLQQEALASPDVVARFMREARAAVRIKSEHVARVLDVGALDSGAPYMVMERLEGSDLAALLRAKGRLSIDIAVDYTLQALEAIAEAHSIGIVHRDLKPANLFLVSGSRSEKIKVLDFGISKTIFVERFGRIGNDANVGRFGTPAYVSPEQLNSARDVDARGDVWSLGVILYELLAGETPFRADTVPQLCVAIMNHPMPALRAIRNDVPAGARGGDSAMPEEGQDAALFQRRGPGVVAHRIRIAAFARSHFTVAITTALARAQA